MAEDISMDDVEVGVALLVSIQVQNEKGTEKDLMVLFVLSLVITLFLLVLRFVLSAFHLVGW
jgi:hypothetical protein